MKVMKHIRCLAVFITLVSAVALCAQEQASGEASPQVAAETRQSADSAEKPNTSNQTQDVQADTKTGPVDTVEAETKKASPRQPAALTVKPAQQKNARPEPAVAPAPAKQVSDEKGLLDLDDDNLKFTRIPGIPAVKNEVSAESVDTVQVPREDSAVAESQRGDSEKGFLGMSKKTGDIVTRVALVLLIVVIFVLYRLRSRGGSRSVLRSYPKR